MQLLTVSIDQPILQSQWFSQGVAHGMAIQTVAREFTRIVMKCVQSLGIVSPTCSMLAMMLVELIHLVYATMEQNEKEAAEGVGRPEQHLHLHLHLHLHQRTLQAMGDFGSMALIKAEAQHARQVTWPMVGWIPTQSMSCHKTPHQTTMEIHTLWRR